jgi:hypothetical protein
MTATRFHTSYTRQIARWLLRGLSPDVTFFFSDHEGSILNYGDDNIPGFLGLPARAVGRDLRGIRCGMQGLLTELEATVLPVGLPRRAEAGLEELAQYFELSLVEAALARFLACARTEVLIAGLQRLAWHAIAGDPARYFARVLALPLREVAKALSPEGRLFDSGLLENGFMEWSEKTTPVFGPVVLAHQIMRECPILAFAHPLSSLWMSDEAMFNGFRVPSSPPGCFQQMLKNQGWPNIRFPN